MEFSRRNGYYHLENPVSHVYEFFDSPLKQYGTILDNPLGALTHKQVKNAYFRVLKTKESCSPGLSYPLPCVRQMPSVSRQDEMLRYDDLRVTCRKLIYFC